MCRRLYLLIALIGVLTPAVAYANAGTPLVWATAAHLLFGNALVGIIEGLVVAHVFRAGRWRVVWRAACANYVSAFPGLFLASWLSFAMEGWLVGPGLWRGPYVLVAGLAIAFATSAVIEWPFFYWALPDGAPHLGRSIRATLLAQAASYALLVPAFLYVSQVTVFTATDIHRDAGFAREPIADVYFLNPDDGTFRRIRTDGSGLTVLRDGLEIREDERVAVLGTDGRASCELWRVSNRRSDGSWVNEALLADVSASRFAAEAPADVMNTPGGQPPVPYSWASSHDLRESQPWSAHCSSWPTAGLIIGERAGQPPQQIALETSFMGWTCRNVTVLPSGQIIFRLGPNIVLYDPESTKLAALARGIGPAVVVPK